MKPKILDLDTEDAWTHLATYRSLSDDRIAYDNMLRYVRDKLKCKTVVVEQGYVCKDFRDEFSAIYSKSFRRYHGYSTRLHFFRSKLETIGQVRSAANKDYLGFSVIRPIEVHRVGKTILTPWSNGYIHNTYYPLCATDFTAHIFGREFKFHGIPYVQQDSMVMVCAHAAIWMASRYLHRCNQGAETLPSQINAYASQTTSHSARSLPSDGLTDMQMIGALQRMGYAPYYYNLVEGDGEHKDDNSNNEDDELGDEYLLSKCYPYLESKIPVMLGMQGHVITAIGHTFDPNPAYVDHLVNVFAQKNETRIFPSELWISGLIVHDDSQGPYRLLPIDEEYRTRFKRKPTFKQLLYPETSTYKTFEDVISVLVPLPGSIYLLSKHMDEHVKLLFAEGIIAELTAMADSKLELLNYLKPKNKNPIVTRSYFTSSVDYKNTLLKRLERDSSLSKLFSIYGKLHMPQYIWVCEITTKEYFSQRREEERLILGEIIIDAKAHKFFPYSFIAIHLPGIVCTQNHQGGGFKFHKLSNKTAYRHNTRRLSMQDNPY